MSLNAVKTASLSFLVAAAVAAAPLALLWPATAHAAPPTISSLTCSNLPYGPEFTCIATFSSNLPATVAWSGADGASVDGAGVSYFFGQCANGDSVMIRVTVTNADGTAIKSTKRYRCIVG